MKVGFIGAVPFNLLYGGGETQMQNTFSNLLEQGVDVSYFDFYDKNVHYDLVHIFGLHYWHYNNVLLLKNKSYKIALSSISYAPGKLRKEKLWSYIDPLMPVNTTFGLNKKILDLVDVVLPNSICEAKYLEEYHGVNKNKISVIPNGINLPNKNVNLDLFTEQFGVTDYILCVGKIEPRKNQLLLIDAIKKTNLKCVFLGSAMLTNVGYYQKFKDLIIDDPRFIHIDYIEHNSELMSSLYANCKVHVLLGTNETPGLVNLEAGSFGANLIVWDCPPVKEYLKDFATYINKSNLSSLPSILENLIRLPKNHELSKFIIDNYAWSNVAARTFIEYTKII